jgi:hypothetical protein
VEANSTGDQGSRRAVVPNNDDDNYRRHIITATDSVVK